MRTFAAGFLDKEAFSVLSLFESPMAPWEITMNIRNCKMCGRIFNYVAGPVLCPSCRESMEAKFQEVKEYIREHRGVGIAEVAEACDVDAGQIRQWLREERLEVTEDSVIFLSCESCGAPIRCGRFCDKCKNEVTKGFRDIVQANREATQAQQRRDGTDPSARMRFL